MKQSPEITGAWQCKCGNVTDFIGIDAHGYGGPEACVGFDEETGKFDCPKCPDKNENYCACETELTQPFSVLWNDDGSYEPGNLEYERFEGGCCDAEIGSYTTILCAECGDTLWQEEDAS